MNKISFLGCKNIMWDKLKKIAKTNFGRKKYNLFTLTHTIYVYKHKLYISI